MALKIVTGGTTGAADGTLVSSGNPLVIVALNTAVDAHIRCDDGYWSNDQVFDIPAGLEVSFDGGSTWYGNDDEPITAPAIEDVNVAIKIRQTTAAASTSGSFITDGTYSLIPLDNVTGFAADVSGTTVDLSWNAVTGAHHYTIEWGTDGVTYGSTISDQTGTTYSHTGRSANTTYYYRIKAHLVDHSAPSASWATCYAGVQILILAATTREIDASAGSWASARGGGGAVAGTVNSAAEAANLQEFAGTYYVNRILMDFTTSGGVIPSGVTIDEAWLRLTNTADATTTNGVSICKGTWTNDPPLAADFTAITISDLGGPSSNPTNNTPTDYAITSPDSNVTKNGTARFALIERNRDLANSAPSAGTWHGHTFGGKGNGTTDYRPQLKVSFHG